MPKINSHLDTKRSAAFQELLYVAQTLVVVFGLLKNLQKKEYSKESEPRARLSPS